MISSEVRVSFSSRETGDRWKDKEGIGGGEEEEVYMKRTVLLPHLLRRR